MIHYSNRHCLKTSSKKPHDFFQDFITENCRDFVEDSLKKFQAWFMIHDFQASLWESFKESPCMISFKIASLIDLTSKNHGHSFFQEFFEEIITISLKTERKQFMIHDFLTIALKDFFKELSWFLSRFL